MLRGAREDTILWDRPPLLPFYRGSWHQPLPARRGPQSRAGLRSRL